MRRVSSVLVILLSAAAAHADSAPTDRITIDPITITGTGCLPGTAALTVAPDNTEFSITYTSYTAQVGVGARPVDARKNCRLNLLVHVPPGFAYSIASVEYRGFASLAEGASALVRSSYFFQGESPAPFKELRISGPYFDEWQYPGDTIGIPTIPSCGRVPNLNISTEIQVSAGTSDTATTTSWLSLDSEDGSITTHYRFFWKHCP